MERVECPQCGASATPSDRKCSYCKAEFFITSIAYLSNLNQGGVQKYLSHFKSIINDDANNVEGHIGLGLCYLELGLYKLAKPAFDKALNISPELPHAYYYRCISTIAGRRIMTISLKEAREIQDYLNTAIQLDPSQPQYTILLSMIKYDYYLKNGMKIPPPSHQDLLTEINHVEVNQAEIERLKQCVRVPDFSIFNI